MSMICTFISLFLPSQYALSPLSTMLAVLLLSSLSILNIYLASRAWFDKGPTYDYIGTSHPLRLPTPLPPVQMHFYDSLRYPISLPLLNNETHSQDHAHPSPHADHFPAPPMLSSQIWDSPFPPDYGYTRHGPSFRVFYNSMWHQLHCLTIVQRLLTLPPDEARDLGGDGHLQHCLNYIRMYLLCNADDTLEPGDFLEGYGEWAEGGYISSEDQSAPSEDGWSSDWLASTSKRDSDSDSDWIGAWDEYTNLPPSTSHSYSSSPPKTPSQRQSQSQPKTRPGDGTYTRTCVDWTRIYDYNEVNDMAFRSFVKSQDAHPHSHAH